MEISFYNIDFLNYSTIFDFVEENLFRLLRGHILLISLFYFHGSSVSNELIVKFLDK